MSEISFKERLNEIILKIKKANQKSDSANPSYAYLLNKFLKINTISDLKEQKDIIMHFLVDSYNGDKEISREIGEFLTNYSVDKRK